MGNIVRRVKAWFDANLWNAAVIAVVAILVGVGFLPGACAAGAFGASMQVGGGRLGGVGLATGTTSTQNLLNCPKGPVDSLYVTVSLTGASAGAGFVTVVGTGANAVAEGVDDIDIAMGNGTVGVFNNITFYWEQDNIAGTLTPRQWRTILGMLNQRDFGGTFVNGAAIAAAGGSTTLRVTMCFPCSINKYLKDGVIYTQGSSRLKHGQFDYNVRTTTPAIVLANGTFTLTGVTVAVHAELGIGTEGDLGPTWRVNRYAGLPTNYVFPANSGGRLALLDTSTVAASAITAVSVGEFVLWDPATFGGRYQADRLFDGGYDITARCTPFIFMTRDNTFSDMVNFVNREIKIDAIGVATLTMYEVVSVPPSGSAVEAVATELGGGGSIGQTRPTPPSLPAGSPIPATLEHMAPIRIAPGSLPGAGRRSPNPVAAGNAAEGRKLVASSAKARLNSILGRRGGG